MSTKITKQGLYHIREKWAQCVHKMNESFHAMFEDETPAEDSEECDHTVAIYRNGWWVCGTCHEHFDPHETQAKRTFDEVWIKLECGGTIRVSIRPAPVEVLR